MAPPVASTKEGGDKIEVVQPDEQQQFLNKLLDEFRTIKSFAHNPGVPKGELKLLDDDALDQLESRLSVDDQCVFVTHIGSLSPNGGRTIGTHQTLGFRDLQTYVA